MRESITTSLDSCLCFVDAMSAYRPGEQKRSRPHEKILALYGVDEVGSCLYSRSSGFGLLSFDIDKGLFPIKGSHIFQGLFDSLARHHTIDGIFGAWTEKKTANLDTFNQLCARGYSHTSAALETFTGKMALRNGFSDVRILFADEVQPTVYRCVRTIFFQPHSAFPDFISYMIPCYEDF